MARNNLADQLGNEVICYGGFPMRRIDAYKLAERDGCSARTCDLVAFGPQARRMDCEPMPLAEVIAVIDGFEARVAA